MVLLMAGVIRGEVSAPAVNSACITMLFLVALSMLFVPPGRHELFGGSFVVDDFSRVSQGADAGRLGRRAAACRSII